MIFSDTWKEYLLESEKYMKCKKPSQQELILVLLHNILEAEFLEHTHWKESYFSAFADN